MIPCTYPETSGGGEGVEEKDTLYLSRDPESMYLPRDPESMYLPRGQGIEGWKCQRIAYLGLKVGGYIRIDNTVMKRS